VTEALKGEDVEVVKKALDELSEKSQEIGKALYASGQTGTAQTSSASGASEDVVDAEIVDDEENK
jgi:chaperone protein dnaK